MSDFTETLDQVLSEVISIYGEGRLTKADHELSITIVSILLCILDTCVLPTEIEKNKEYVIDNNILCKVADLEDIIKIDNVLGGNDILKFDVPEFEPVFFEEIRIDDLTEDDIENKIGNSRIKYKGYPFGLDELVID
jgi:hypothetical protein